MDNYRVMYHRHFLEFLNINECIWSNIQSLLGSIKCENFQIAGLAIKKLCVECFRAKSVALQLLNGRKLNGHIVYWHKIDGIFVICLQVIVIKHFLHFHERFTSIFVSHKVNGSTFKHQIGVLNVGRDTSHNLSFLNVPAIVVSNHSKVHFFSS